MTFLIDHLFMGFMINWAHGLRKLSAVWGSDVISMLPMTHDSVIFISFEGKLVSAVRNGLDRNKQGPNPYWSFKILLVIQKGDQGIGIRPILHGITLPLKSQVHSLSLLLDTTLNHTCFYGGHAYPCLTYFLSGLLLQPVREAVFFKMIQKLQLVQNAAYLMTCKVLYTLVPDYPRDYIISNDSFWLLRSFGDALYPIPSSYEVGFIRRWERGYSLSSQTMEFNPLKKPGWLHASCPPIISQRPSFSGRLLSDK